MGFPRLGRVSEHVHSNWDKANVSGKTEFPGLVEQATKWVGQAPGRDGSPARTAPWRLAGRPCPLADPDSNTVDMDRQVEKAVRKQHRTVIAYVNSPIGTSAQEMSAARAPVEDVPIIDFINYVQADAVKQGSPERTRPCRCCRSRRRSTGRRRFPRVR
jgi:2',3'-cyclic-nucleotide 2'-phosphodiesterase (5'-nucleotidase family)